MYKQWQCEICGYVYDESRGIARDKIAKGTRFEDIHERWVCPACQVGKKHFHPYVAKRSAPLATVQPIPFVDWPALLDEFLASAQWFFSPNDERPIAVDNSTHLICPKPVQGVLETLNYFNQHCLKNFNNSAGSRYFGFVTGGVTPAALIGDWLTSMLDQNAMGSLDSFAPQVELEAIRLFRQLVKLPDNFIGSFMSGATMSNFAEITVGRQWIGQQRGIDVAQEGIAALGAVTILSGTPHSSIYKALAMAGMGRNNLQRIDTLKDREAIDTDKLALVLSQQPHPCLVVANAGTINTVDFDNFRILAELKKDYPFWLHIDAAFGGFAGCSPRYHDLVDGWECADSITIDAHKWLNVPYDSALFFTRHQALQNQVFQNTATYLPTQFSTSNFVHLTPENSRRLRALSAWFTLSAYGNEGYSKLVEYHAELAFELARRIKDSPLFHLLAEVKLNGICFTLKTPVGMATHDEIQHYLHVVLRDGRIFMTPTQYKEQPAIRIAICNWKTNREDIDIAWQALYELHPYNAVM